MTGVASRWRELSGSAKFRLCSQLILLSSIVVGVVVSVDRTGDVPWSAAGIVISGAAALLALQTRPELSAWPNVGPRSWALPVGSAMFIVVWLFCAIMANLATDESDIDAAQTVGNFAALLSMLSIIPFLRGKWWFVLGVSIATGAAFEASAPSALRVAATTFFIGALFVATTLLTMWGLEVVDELERTKAVEARLQVAEERLRFARDLHDVVGRGFSAIAVKSELAATLSRAGAGDRAAGEMDEVKALAVESMNTMRELVHGYRGINLVGEVAGARSLLAAAGCLLVVEGDPAKVPARFHEVAAWVVREGTTNIVRHSASTSATLSIGTGGMSLRNNGSRKQAVDDPGEHSGLRGLSERLAHVGSGLEATMSGETFTLEILWEKK